jgi:hypothetical protein
MPGTTIHWDLNTFRHPATNLLIYKQIRLHRRALCPRKDSPSRPPVMDYMIVASGEIIATLRPHRCNIVTSLQRCATMADDTVQLVRQRPFAPLRQIQLLRVTNTVHHLLHAVGMPVVPHAYKLYDQNLWSTNDTELSLTVACIAFTCCCITLQPILALVGGEMLLKIPIQCTLRWLFWHCEIDADVFTPGHVDLVAILTSPSRLCPQIEKAIDGYIPMAMSALNGLRTRSWLHGLRQHAKDSHLGGSAYLMLCPCIL